MKINGKKNNKNTLINLGKKITELARGVNPETGLLYNPKECRGKKEKIKSLSFLPP